MTARVSPEASSVRAGLFTDICYAQNLTRGVRINIAAALDAALGETDKRFFWDNIDPDDDGILDATVEGASTSQGCTTVHTDLGAFSVPEDFAIRVTSWTGD